MLYRIDDYTESETNPVTGRVYDDSWIVYCLTDSSDYQMMVGNRHACVYTVKVSRHYNNWEMSVCDFLQFQESRQKTSFCPSGRKIWKRHSRRIEGIHITSRSCEKMNRMF